MNRFDQALRVADAVLYEGYVLYPYRASAGKNQVRWQFGVLAPRTWSEAGGGEHWWLQSEMLVSGPRDARISGRLRFLQPRLRRIEAHLPGGVFEPVPSLDVGGELHTRFDEGIERSCELRWQPQRGPLELPFGFAEKAESAPIHGPEGLAGRRVQEATAVSGRLRLEARPMGAGTWKLHLRIENTSPWDDPQAPRDRALQAAMVGVHALLEVHGGEFVSAIDPPAPLREAAAACQQVRVWPVLAGPESDRSLMLVSPIILYDHPQIAPESPGDFFDATEIDEMLSLRTATLTDAEKREARATDPRAAEIIERCEDLPPEALARMHGALRSLRALRTPAAETLPTFESLFEGPSPEEARIEVDGRVLRRGSLVRLRPRRNADAQDFFLEGRVARVEGVFSDVDGGHYLGVVPTDDPAGELHASHGRFFYFHPDEVEPMGEGDG